MDFTKFKCDGCQRQFNENDDVVVCPVCGTPQHRHCWEQNGECVNAARHEEGFTFDVPYSPDAEAEKPKDGENIEKPQNPFAQWAAGGEIPKVDEIIEQRVKALCPGITAEQRQEKVCDSEIGLTTSFVGNQAPKYINKFRKIESGRHTFNWAAFFFAPYWLFWRKMYLPGFIVAAFHIVMSVIEQRILYPLQDIIMAFYSDGLDSLGDAEFQSMVSAAWQIWIIFGIIFAVHLFLGIFADKLYHNHCTQQLKKFAEIRQEENEPDDEEYSLRFYISKSSTSVAATLTSILAVGLVPDLITRFFLN